MTIWTKTLAGSLIGLAGMTAAQASVMYDWNPIGNTDRFSTTGGQVVLSDAAARAGAVLFEGSSYDYQGSDGPLYPDSPILNVALNVINPGSLFDDDTFHITADPGQPSPRGNDIYSLKADLMSTGDFLFGSLDLITVQDEFHMSAADDGLWTVTRFGSDAGSLECFTDGCGGATGRWVLASNTIDMGTVVVTDVAAPGALGLFALSVLGLFGLARRRAA